MNPFSKLIYNTKVLYFFFQNVGTKNSAFKWVNGSPLSNTEWNNVFLSPGGPNHIMHIDPPAGHTGYQQPVDPWYQPLKKYIEQLQPAVDFHCTAMVYLSTSEPVDWIQIPCDKSFPGVSFVCSHDIKLDKSSRGVEDDNIDIGCLSSGVLHQIGEEFICLVLLPIIIDFPTVVNDINATEHFLGKRLLHLSHKLQIRSLQLLLEPIISNQDAAFIFVYNQICSILYAGKLIDNSAIIEKWHIFDCFQHVNLGVSQIPTYMVHADPAVEVNTTCRNGHFTCSLSNTCIIQNLVCDGIKDCPHGEDESCPRIPDVCKTVCDSPSKHCVCSGTLYFQCTNGEYVSELGRCDYVLDCSDRSDEIGCSRNCSSSEFQCKSGQCIPFKYRYIPFVYKI